MSHDFPAIPAGGQETARPASAPPGPPVAPARPGGDGRRPDPYAWMRDTSDPALLGYLAAERAYYEEQTAAAAPLREELTAELVARTDPAEESVGWRRGPWRYFTRALPGLNYEQFCRRPWHGGAAGTQVLLDE